MIMLLEPPLRYFSLYVAVITGLTAAQPTAWVLPFGALLAAMAWVGKRYRTERSWNRLAAVCGCLGIGMNVSYGAMAGAVPVVRAERYDAYLLAIDRFLLGETPSVAMGKLAAPWLTDLMSLCYILFMPLLFFSLLRYFFRNRTLLGEFYTGLFQVYGLGFIGYVAGPGAGPWLAYPDLFSAELTGGAMTAANQTMVVQGSNRVDVWPSLHCAVSAYILGFAWRHHRAEFFGLLLPVAGLWASTLYLRYHYFFDVMCGIALAALALHESRRYSRNLPDHHCED